MRIPLKPIFSGFLVTKGCVSLDEILRVENMSKSFPGVKALNNLSLSIFRGEIHALLGENGAGKSTFIKILGGVYKCDSGKIIIEGKEVDIKSPLDSSNSGIVVLHQELNVVPWLDVATNFMLGSEKTLSPFKLINKMYSINKCEEAIALLGHNIDVRKRMGDLSFSEKQIVEIAKVVSKKPKIVIMDEPTAALAQKEREKLFNVIRMLKDQGVSIIFITHIFDEVFKLSDKVTVLRDGEYIGTENTSKLNVNTLIKMVVGREIILHHRESQVKDEVVLKVENLSRKDILKNVSFFLRRGEILGLAGLAGSGRTEIIRALFGADPIDEGYIYFEGKRIKIKSPYHAYKIGIALVPEERKTQGLLMEMTMEYNLVSSKLKKACGKMEFLSYKRIRKIANQVIDKFDINPRDPVRKAKYFSGGNQQKLVVSRCLFTDPKVLIVDEPTRGVDVGAKEEIHSILAQMVRDGKSIIVVSSELPEILKLSDRVLIIRDGTVVAELDKESVTQESIIAYAMGGKKYV